MVLMWKESSRLTRAAICIGLIGAVLSILASMRDCFSYGGIDGRGRVVGARLIVAGMSPYTVWRPQMGEWFLYPWYLYPTPANPGVNGTAVPPTGFLPYIPFSGLPYGTQRVIWVFLEWAALLASVYLLLKATPGREVRMALLAITLLFFVCSYFWRAHVERGQTYVFVVLLISLVIHLDRRWPGRAWLAGLPLGLAVSLRPTCAVIVLALLLLGRWKTAVSAMCATAGLILVSLLIGGFGPWRDYTKIVEYSEKGMIERGVAQIWLGNSSRVPRIIEGEDLKGGMDSRTQTVTFIRLAQLVENEMGLLGMNVRIDRSSWNKLLSGALALAWLALLLATRRKHWPMRYVLFLGIVFMLNMDYFVPIRFGYADILFLPALAMGMPLLLNRRCPAWVLGMALLGLAFGVGMIADMEWVPATWMRSVFFMGAMNILALAIVWRRIVQPKKLALSPAQGKGGRS